MSDSTTTEGTLPTDLPTTALTDIPTALPTGTGTGTESGTGTGTGTGTEGSQSGEQQQSTESQETTAPPTSQQTTTSEPPPASSDPPPSSSNPNPPPSSSNPPVSSGSTPPSSSNPPPSSSNPPPSSSRPSSIPPSTSESSSSTTTSAPSTTTTESHGPTSFTTFVTTSNGQVTTVTSALPSLWNPASSNNDNNINRTAIIAGSTVAGLVLLFLLLAALFIWRRHKNREITFIENIIRRGREGKGAGSVGLLDDEFDDDDNVPMQRYRDAPGSSHTPSGSVSHPPSLNYATPMALATPMSNVNVNASVSSVNTVSRQAPASPAPSLFRTRASDSGSIFHEHIPGSESVRFVDPLTNGSNVDLSSIVTDVMGPGMAAAAGGAAVAAGTSATAPSASSASVAPTRGLPPGAAAPAVYVDPFAAGSRSSFYSPGHTKDASAASIASSVSSDSGPKSLLGLPAGVPQTTPKKPSPLAQAVATDSASALPQLNIPSTPTSSKAEVGLGVPSTPKSSRPSTPTTPSKTTNWLNRSPKPEALKSLNAKRDSRDLEYEYVFRE